MSKIKSIIQGEKECYLCHSQRNLQNHHCIGGSGKRKLSDKWRLTVFLCINCHDHNDQSEILKLKEIAQKRAMEYYGWTTEKFIQIFGKNYL